jgi:hypothetical protein
MYFSEISYFVLDIQRKSALKGYQQVTSMEEVTLQLAIYMDVCRERCAVVVCERARVCTPLLFAIG